MAASVKELSVEDRLMIAMQNVALLGRLNYALAAAKGQRLDVSQGYDFDSNAQYAATRICEETYDHLAAVVAADGGLSAAAPAPDRS
jgi:hypothetical protein